MADREVILELKNIVKVFPGVRALDKVNLTIRKGEVHALCGENGAGKSTLMKIISGAYTYTEGEMFFNNQKVTFHNTKEAQDHGISMIYQEFNLIPHLSVAENILLGRLPRKKSGLVDWKKAYEDVGVILSKIGLSIHPKTLVSRLSVAQSQMIEIAKCLSTNAKVIIMDEPTAALTDEEIKALFNIIDGLLKEGIAIIYISHRMDEIFNISHRLTVFRDGKYVASMETEDTNYDELVSLMVGKNITDLYPIRDYQKQEVVLEVKNISGPQVKSVDFQLYKGEILGIAGLMGAGNIELSKMIYGALTKKTGGIWIKQKEVSMDNPLEAIKNGIGLVPDDRKQEGLVLIRSVRENGSMASLDSIIQKGLICKEKEQERIKRNIDTLKIKVSSPDQIVGNLSGGNQQKVVFAKILETNPDVWVLDEPTRGVDVGAKAEIYQIMHELTMQGKSIILISSDLPELIGMSDRVLIMKEGEIVKELQRSEATQESVLAYASGGVCE